MVSKVLLSEVLDMPSREVGFSHAQLRMRHILDRKRSDEFYPELVESMRENGMSCPVLIIDGVFENGHHRVAAAQDLGWTEISCTETPELGWAEDWPEEQAPESWTWEEEE